MRIRPAVNADATALAAVKAAASGSDAQPAHLEELIRRPGELVFVAEDGGPVVGYLALRGRAHPAIEARNPIQLLQLYVLPALHGSGVAAQLMSAGLDHARGHLHDVMWLGVAEHNARGMAFYRKHGFASHGLHDVGGGDHVHQDIVMSRAVAGD